MVKLNNDITIYNDNCFSVMEDLKQNKVNFDLILTDPPYGTITKIWNFKPTNWDVKLNTSQLFKSSADLLRNNGRLILFSQEPYTSELRTNYPSSFSFTQSAIWLKRSWGNMLGVNKNLLNVYEDINLFKKKYDNLENPIRKYAKQVFEYIGLTNAKINKILGNRKAEHFFYFNNMQFELCSETAYNELIEKFNINNMSNFIDYKTMKETYKNNTKQPTYNLNGAKHKTNLFEYPKETKKYHTAQKPIDLLVDLIKTYTNEGDLVLDFTMGSGSTGVACVLTNRKFIGIELNKDFYNIAKERIKRELQKCTMF